MTGLGTERYLVGFGRGVPRHRRVENGRNADDDDFDGDSDDGGDQASPPAEPETSTGNYCTPWESFAQYGLPHLGKVNLYENGVFVTQYQGSRESATARCQASLARLGQ
ncbi:hypothetical protein [Candidatus Poriferisodalis sp.]|uniref:hypothetical protein n=1 Tax=Candidatus Poriferisodalis sp. TaxID=3101277 RepID=UPI003B527C41